MRLIYLITTYWPNSHDRKKPHTKLKWITRPCECHHHVMALQLIGSLWQFNSKHISITLINHNLMSNAPIFRPKLTPTQRDIIRFNEFIHAYLCVRVAVSSSNGPTYCCIACILHMIQMLHFDFHVVFIITIIIIFGVTLSCIFNSVFSLLIFVFVVIFVASFFFFLILYVFIYVYYKVVE